MVFQFQGDSEEYCMKEAPRVHHVKYERLLHAYASRKDPCPARRVWDTVLCPLGAYRHSVRGNPSPDHVRLGILFDRV